jgi:hypothetical protein
MDMISAEGLLSSELWRPRRERESPGWGRWLAGPRAPAAASIKEEDAGQGVGRRKRKQEGFYNLFLPNSTSPSNNSVANVKWSQDVSDGR